MEERQNFNLAEKKKIVWIRLDPANGAGDCREDVWDTLVTEYPFTIFFNETELATLLCSPDELEALAYGFLFGEGLIDEPGDLDRLEIDPEKGEARALTERTNLAAKVVGRRFIPSGCGSGSVFYRLQDVLSHRKVGKSLKVEAVTLLQGMRGLQKRAPVFRETGGTHAAALFMPGSGLLYSFEDIGRHNAVDKIVGRCLLDGVDPADKVLLTTGRLSSEMVLKTARIGIPVLVSRSAPTVLAARTAEELGVTLVGFCRGRRLSLYSHPERILGGGLEPGKEDDGGGKK